MANLDIYRSQERLPGTAGGVQAPTNLTSRPFAEGAALAQEFGQFGEDIAIKSERDRRSRIALEETEKMQLYRSALGDVKQKISLSEGMQVLRYETDENGNPLSVTEYYGKQAAKLQEEIKFGPDWKEEDKQRFKINAQGIYFNSVNEIAGHEAKQKRIAGATQLKLTQQELVKSAADTAERFPGYYPKDEIEQAASTIELLRDNGFLSDADAEESMMIMDKSIISGTLDRLLISNPDAVEFLMNDKAGEQWQESLTADEITAYKKSSQTASKVKLKSEINGLLAQENYAAAKEAVEANSASLTGTEIKSYNDAINNGLKGDEELQISDLLRSGDYTQATVAVDRAQNLSGDEKFTWQQRIDKQQEEETEPDNDEKNRIRSFNAAQLEVELDQADLVDPKVRRKYKLQIANMQRDGKISPTHQNRLYGRIDRGEETPDDVKEATKYAAKIFDGYFKLTPEAFGEDEREQELNYVNLKAKFMEYATQEGRTAKEIQGYLKDLTEPYVKSYLFGIFNTEDANIPKRLEERQQQEELRDTARQLLIKNGISNPTDSQIEIIYNSLVEEQAKDTDVNIDREESRKQLKIKGVI